MPVCVCMCFLPVKSDVRWVTMTGVPPTIPSGGWNCSVKRNSFHFSCLPARKLSERHFTVCVQVQWSLIFFHSCSETSSVALPTHNYIFHPLLLDNLASAHLDTLTLSRSCPENNPNVPEATFLSSSVQGWAGYVSTVVHVNLCLFSPIRTVPDGEKQPPTTSCKCDAENTQIAWNTLQLNVKFY